MATAIHHLAPMHRELRQFKMNQLHHVQPPSQKTWWVDEIKQKKGIVQQPGQFQQPLQVHFDSVRVETQPQKIAVNATYITSGARTAPVQAEMKPEKKLEKKPHHHKHHKKHHKHPEKPLPPLPTAAPAYNAAKAPTPPPIIETQAAQLRRLGSVQDPVIVPVSYAPVQPAAVTTAPTPAVTGAPVGFAVVPRPAYLQEIQTYDRGSLRRSAVRNRSETEALPKRNRFRQAFDRLKTKAQGWRDKRSRRKEEKREEVEVRKVSEAHDSRLGETGKATTLQSPWPAMVLADVRFFNQRLRPVETRETHEIVVGATPTPVVQSTKPQHHRRHHHKKRAPKYRVQRGGLEGKDLEYYFRFHVLPQIRSFDRRSLHPVVFTPWPPIVLAAIRVFPHSMLHHVAPWTPVPKPLLYSLKHFDKSQLRPRYRQPYSKLTLHFIRTFDRKRLRSQSQRIASPWPRAVLHDIKRFDRRRLHKIASPGFFGTTRSIGVTEMRQHPMLPLELKKQIHNAYAFPVFRRHVEIEERFKWAEIPSLAELRASSARRWNPAQLAEIRSFPRSKLRHYTIRSPWPQDVLMSICRFDKSKLKHQQPPMERIWYEVRVETTLTAPPRQQTSTRAGLPGNRRGQIQVK